MTAAPASPSPPARIAGRARAATSPRPPYDVERLLAVAVEVFIERGYDGTSMEDLARATGISKSSIYHHVESKETLLRLALERALDALFAIAGEEGAQSPLAVDRLRYVIGRVVEVLCAELPYVTLLLRVRGNTATERRALDRRREFDRFVQSVVAEASSKGQLLTDLPADAGRAPRLRDDQLDHRVVPPRQGGCRGASDRCRRLGHGRPRR